VAIARDGADVVGEPSDQARHRETIKDDAYRQRVTLLYTTLELVLAYEDDVPNLPRLDGFDFK
jgi:hypothetical protein